ncbi:MAG: arginase [Hyphomicrobiales bacterium]|nr:arginase [Hyphomicrobiales bacterium]MDE2017744.1 arginase [Hyphomicrobiales bacterium]
MDATDIVILGAPVREGAGRRGCDMGPAALRAAGIVETLGALGHRVEDRGDLAGPRALPPRRAGNPALRNFAEVVDWAGRIEAATFEASARGMPVTLGGDHSLAAGTLPAFARRARERGRPAFALWLDAHPDFHTLETTTSGNLHGVPLAYACGRPGFDGWPAPEVALDPANVCMIGLRSVDPAERAAVVAAGATAHDMRDVDEHGVGALVRAFLARVAAAGGELHLSLDVDFLDPSIAPGVGTTVPGGATFREAHLVMETVHDCGLLAGLDLVELNPYLDERGRTARLLADLAASLLGKRIFDRPTRGA